MRRVEPGGKPAPITAQRNAGHPDPPPASVLLHLISKCPQGCLEIGCRMMGEWGVGLGGAGVDSSARGGRLWRAQRIVVHEPHHIPLLPSVYRPPSHPRGGDAPGGEGGMVGLRDDWTPQAPPETTSGALSPVSLREKVTGPEFRRWFRWPLHSGIQSRQERTGAWGGEGGGGGEDQGIVGPFSTPPSLGTPRKNSAKPNTKPALTPTRSHPWHWPKPKKSVPWMGAGQG